MNLKPFFTYYGGKYRLAPKYPKPMFDAIIEPFAGSAGYSLRYSHKQILLCDKSETIVGLWQYLISVTENEILSLPLEITDLRLMSIPQEQRWLIGFWVNKGGISPKNMPSAWMRSGVRPKSYWGEEIRHRIASQLKYIRHWKAILGDYGSLENSSSTWFIDPPYHASGRHYEHSVIDYEKLASWCLERRGQVIVCEQEPADWLPFDKFYDAKGLEGTRGKKVSKEVVWVSKASDEGVVG